MSQLAPGTYTAKLRGTVIIYFAGKPDDPEDNRALMANLPFVVVDGESAGKTIDAQVCFKAKDGTIMTRTIQNMQEVFGMEGANPFWLQYANPDDLSDSRERDLSDKLCQIVVESEEYNGKTYSRVRRINPVGGGGWKPQPADRRSVLAKYGSQFRALSGPAKPAAPKPPPPAPRKSTPPPPPTGPTATMEEAWEECCKANNNDDAQSTAAWYETIEKLFPGKNNSDLTPHDWGKLKDKFADNVPL